ncbi:MAG TPA: sulfotransferase [Aridibacter sp.]|nr:sulfotransferase [Aridibacter sp.]
MFGFGDSKRKIFCISFQRTGTTSVGEFFGSFGFRVATWPVSRANKWTLKWFEGDYESIFNSKDFRDHNVFEDDPWWCLDFYKVLFHRFPASTFVHFTRNSDAWFDSMIRHSNGRTLGNTYRHARIYRRESEFYRKFGSGNYSDDEIDNLLELNESHRRHYIEIYESRNRDIPDFFDRNDPGRLISLRLEDSQKWKKLGGFFDLKVPENLEVHANRSK